MHFDSYFVVANRAAHVLMVTFLYMCKDTSIIILSYI